MSGLSEPRVGPSCLRRFSFARGARVAIAILSIALASGSSAAGQNRPEKLRVFFIGNSLTYANNLPAMVQAMAKSSGRKRLEYKTLTLPDYGLEEHWNQGDAQRIIAKGRWDVVVLQQGPSASPEGRAALLKYTRLFAEEIKRAGARSALYMVWPSQGRAGDFARSNESYRLAARENWAMLFPVGEAWLAAWRRDSSLALYSPDGLHPSSAGSYLAALVIYEQLFGEPARPDFGKAALARINLTLSQVQTLQVAAAGVNAKPELR